MENKYPSKITLIGYMGCGKSYTGRALAAQLNLPFFDLDEVIGQLFGCNQADLMRRKGEVAFREAERKALHIVLNKDKFVLACGGGTPAYYDNIEYLLKNTTVVYLNCGILTLKERLTAEKASRPLIENIADEELEEFIAKHLFERRIFYEQAQIKIVADTLKVEDLAIQLVS
jgi:shikimate kinase